MIAGEHEEENNNDNSDSNINNNNNNVLLLIIINCKIAAFIELTITYILAYNMSNLSEKCGTKVYPPLFHMHYYCQKVGYRGVTNEVQNQLYVIIL